MSLFRWFRSQKPTQAKARRRAVRPSLETLERRDVAANDFITLTGTGNVMLNFDWQVRQTVLWNEIGVYTIDDTAGRVGNCLPGEAGYAQAAHQRGETIFEAGDFEAKTVSVTRTAGTRVAFYMIQNNTRENVLALNPLNANIYSRQAFFSIDVANRDKLDHI